MFIDFVFHLNNNVEQMIIKKITGAHIRMLLIAILHHTSNGMKQRELGEESGKNIEGSLLSASTLCQSDSDK